MITKKDTNKFEILYSFSYLVKDITQDSQVNTNFKACLRC